MKTLLDVLPSDLIFEEGDSITSTIAEEKSEKFEKFLEELEESGKLGNKIEPTIPETSEYVMQATVLNVLNKSVAVKFRQNDNYGYIHKYFKDRPKTLDRLFSIVQIGGVLYSKEDDSITKAVDTDNWIIKDSGYRVENGWVENVDNMVYIEEFDRYYNREDIVVTTDTEEEYPINHTYRYHPDDGSGIQYYRFRDNSPEYRRPVRWNSGPIDSEDPSRRMIGIELEFSEAIDLTKKLSADKFFRNNWRSVRDGSIPENGTELLTKPITLNSAKKYVDALFNHIDDVGAEVDNNCGFHFHISTSDYTFPNITNLIKVCSNIEEDIFSLVPSHRHTNRFCKKISKDDRFKPFISLRNKEACLKGMYGSQENAESRIHGSKYHDARYYWINIDRMYRYRETPSRHTVEFRVFDAKLDRKDVLAKAYLCYTIVEFAKAKTRQECRDATIKDIIEFADGEKKTLIKNLF